jgi:hypothetical protein
MEVGYQKFLNVKVGFFDLIKSSFLFCLLFIESIHCLIPPLPPYARYINFRPFMQKINDGHHLEYLCKNSLHRQRIICRRGKILPKNPICYNGKILVFKSLKIFVIRLLCR